MEVLKMGYLAKLVSELEIHITGFAQPGLSGYRQTAVRRSSPARGYSPTLVFWLYSWYCGVQNDYVLGFYFIIREYESIYLHRTGALFENGLDRPENRYGRYGFASFFQHFHIYHRRG